MTKCSVFQPYATTEHDYDCIYKVIAITKGGIKSLFVSILSLSILDFYQGASHRAEFCGGLQLKMSKILFV